ncbi:pleiotropic drug resistance protein 1-like [Tasmannia lanceolata]|uniref:pleiotropic drug resistance protein 1-like n=1 Tax=Tasmannia lanceolata TaxID=3420 RepID=UPI00406460D8
MRANRAPNSPSEIMWSAGDSPIFQSTHSPAASSMASSYLGISKSVIVIPAQGTETPITRAKMSGVAGSSSAEIQSKIGNASPETTKRVAVRLYESLKKHGLRLEADEAFRREIREEVRVEEDEDRNKKKELMGMEFLMKDGFVSYLRDMARITPPIPQQVIRFSGIKYSRKFEISGEGYATFGNKLLGCFFGPLKTVFQRKNSISLQILKGIDGYVMPGSMTLILGPPGSGKSSLLEILAGRVDRKKDSVVEGVVMYNDKLASEIRLSRLIAYVSGQLNKHLPFLSVRETLEFARDCTQGLRPENFTPQMRKFFAHALVEGQDPFLEYVLEILNLKEVENKLAGEGISDMDRQKLTTAELALGTYSIMLYDQPFSGSDPTATYDLVDTVRTLSRIQQSSAVMSLIHLSQEVFDLFDRIILLKEGYVLFQGPRQDAVPYFTKLGYTKPSHIESGEFLEDIAAGEGSQYVSPSESPLTLDELVEFYKASDHYADVMRIVKADDVTHTYWIESEPGLGLSMKTPSKYNHLVSLEPRQETELVVAKLSSKVGHSGGIESTGRVQVGDVVTGISINNEDLQYLAVGTQETQHEQASQVYSALKYARGHVRLQVERYKEEAIVLGVFAGTLFYKLGNEYSQQKMNSIRALGFVSTMSIMLINLVQLPLYMLQRPVFYKHRSQRFFRASSYTVAHCTVSLPQTFIEALAYTLCVYFPVRLTLKGNGVLFFEYLFLLFLVAYFGSSVFFFLSAISSIPEVGNALAGLIVSIFLLFSGFVIYPTNIPPYWKWLVYVNPIHWANLSFCNLQFSKGYTEPCTAYLNQFPFCNQFPTMTVGKAYLAYNELDEESGKAWFPYVILLAWTALANLLALVALKKIEFTGTSQSLPQLKKKPVMRNGKEDTENSLWSLSSYDGLEENSGISRYTRPQTPLSVSRDQEDDGRVGNWIKEFRVDMEWNRVGIPVEPVTLLFLNLSFARYEPRSKERIPVFDGVNGYARPATMLALLGGSKESKNTLLKCLSGRSPPNGNLTGKLQANGSKLSNAFSRITGYVEKLDAHQPYLSVRESLQFSAELRLDRSISSMSRNIHVELVLDQLGLLPYANQLVGSLRDVTGKTFEIAKKITIAVELAANPSLLFLEESISGLDTAGTLNILKTLSQVSASSRTVVATLTHPNARVLTFFDQALILTQDGHQGYFGPIGIKCKELLDYFTSIPKAPQYFQKQSPILFVMGSLGLGIKMRGTPVVDFAEIYRKSVLCETNQKEIIRIKKLGKQRKLKITQSTYPTPYIRQAWLVLLRTQRFLWRNVQYTYARLTGCVMIGLLMGSLYFQIEYSDIYGVTSRVLYIYMQIILIGVISANNIIPQIGTDRLVYFRERRARMYLPIFYPVSWAVGEIPYFLIATLALVGIGNGMAGIATGTTSKFLAYWLTLFVFTVCVTYFGMMLTFLAPVPTLAAFAVSIVTSMWVSASGVVVVFSDIKFYKWLYWSNPFQFAMNTLTSISFYCETKQCGSDCRCPRLPDGSYVWERLKSTRTLRENMINTDIAILTGMCVLFSSLAFIFFVLLKHNSPPPA